MLVETKIETFMVFKYHWKILTFYGFVPPQRDSNWFKPYVVFAICLHFTILLFPTSLLINVILSKNLAELSENIYITTTDIMVNLKFLNIYLARNKLLKVVDILKRLDARAVTPLEKANLKNGTVAARNVFLFFASLLGCLILTCQVVLYFASDRILMYPAWFPWDWKASKRNFLLAHSYQLYGSTVQIVQSIVIDTFPPMYLIIISAQIKALSIRIMNLGCTDTCSEEVLYTKLTDCIKDQNTIHKLFLTIHDIISTPCLLQFVATGISQCTMGVYILYVGVEPTKLPNLIVFFMGVTTQIFILCYYGDLYCQANDYLIDAIYACNWVDRSQKFKKTLLFLLQRAQKPTAVMAGNLIPVRMPTFVSVMKTAYSVFTVLRDAD